MSEKNKSAVESVTFAVRNIKKVFVKPVDTDVITQQFHLELGDKGEAVIVQDRDRDWKELANKDIDSVGLENALENARRAHLDPRTAFAFNDNEALDLSHLDPMNPQSVKADFNGYAENKKKLEETASALGLSIEGLIKVYEEGRLSTVIEEYVKSKTTSEGGSK